MLPTQPARRPSGRDPLERGPGETQTKSEPQMHPLGQPPKLWMGRVTPQPRPGCPSMPGTGLQAQPSPAHWPRDHDLFPAPSPLTLAGMWLGGRGSVGGTGSAPLPRTQVMESGPSGRPHLLKILSKEMKFLSGSSDLCRAGSEVPCLPGPPFWGGLGAAVLAVEHRREGFPQLTPAWLQLGLGLTALLRAGFFSIRTPRKRNPVLCPTLGSSSPASEPGCRSLPGTHSKALGRAGPGTFPTWPAWSTQRAEGQTGSRRAWDARKFPRPRRAP